MSLYAVALAPQWPRICAIKVLLPFAIALLAFARPALPQSLPGTLRFSWIGNSSMDHAAKASVPHEVRDLGVSADGTVFTADNSEAGGSGLSVKDGAFFGRYSGYKSGYPCQGLDIAGNPSTPPVRL